MRQLVAYLKDKVTASKALLATRPLAAGDGIDVSSWRSGSFTFPDIGVFLDTDQASDLTATLLGANGIELWGRQFGAWYHLADLADAMAIHLAGAGQGFSEELHDVGDYDELAIVGTKSAGAVTFKFCPMERHTY